MVSYAINLFIKRLIFKNMAKLCSRIRKTLTHSFMWNYHSSFSSKKLVHPLIELDPNNCNSIFTYTADFQNQTDRNNKIGTRLDRF